MSNQPTAVIDRAEAERPSATALIVEGGAMRGAWAAGVLAFLHDRGWRQFDRVYAASSGACSAAYFVAGMWEPGLNIWRNLAANAVRKTNVLRRKPMIDLAYLVDHVFRQHVPLSIEALRQAPTIFHIVLTDCDSGAPVYFHACDERIFAALRATAAMPLATRGFDYVDGRPYADGGVSDPIPLRRAIDDGATDITVVLTHHPDFRMKPAPRWLGKVAYPTFPAVARAWTAGQNLKYNDALALMRQPPAGINIRVFRPFRPLPVGSFTINPRRIAAALALGRADAMEQIQTMPLIPAPVPKAVKPPPSA
jgi:predicted patatin/cPLA2 family phospholipase